MIRFSIISSVVALLLVGATWFLSLKGAFQFPSFGMETTLLLLLSTVFICRFLLRSPEDSFVQLYLLTVVVKLIAFLIYNVLVVMLDPLSRDANVGFFIVSYLIFTFLEIGFLHRKISR